MLFVAAGRGDEMQEDTTIAVITTKGQQWAKVNRSDRTRAPEQKRGEQSLKRRYKPRYPTWYGNQPSMNKTLVQ